MVVVRLSRAGAKKRPFYHLTIADKRKPRDGRFIERVGYFNPCARGQETPLLINNERLGYWISKGAQMSDRVSALVKDGITQKSVKTKLSKKAKVAQEEKSSAVATEKDQAAE